MEHPRTGQTAVIFVSESTGEDEAGYAAAAEAMAALAAEQPGYLGVDWVGDGQGQEITISYWADDASAAAWRAHPVHARTQEAGRGAWLKRYDLMVVEVRRGHRWERA